MASTSLSRRTMLSALAAAGGVSRLGPFLPLSAHAATAPKRILCVFHPMGYLEPSFWPSGTFAPGTMTNFTLGESLTALDPWKGKLILPDGMYMYGSGWLGGEDDNEHGNGSNCVFTGSRKQGYSTGPSIDQVIADAQYAQAKTRYRALALGVNAGGGGGSHTSVFHSKAQTPVIPQSSTQAAFDSLFKDFTGPTSPAATTPSNTVTSAPAPVDTSAADKLRKQKQSVLDMVKNDLNRLKAAAGKDNKAKIEAHLEGISGLENRLLTLPQGGTTPTSSSPVSSAPAAPPGSVADGCAKPTLTSGADVRNSIHSQMDIIAAAFACDMTRSATLQVGICDGSIEVDGLPNQHSTTHDCGPGVTQSTLDNHKKWDKWYVDRWAYLLGKLDSIKEGNGTMLDNTLVVFGSDTTTVQTLEKGAHSFFRFPLWMAGGGNFAFKTGQYIRLPQPTVAPQGLDLIKKWIPHQRLLTSVVRAFGVNADTFGATDPGSGPMTQLQTV